MIKRLGVCLYCLLPLSCLNAQRTIRINPHKVCTFAGRSQGITNLTVWEPDEEAKEIVNQICTLVGIHPNFDLKRSDEVGNATAVVKDGDRMIVYNEDFIRHIIDSSGTYWASVSILAHEIGHHLNGHSLAPSPTSLREELEADEFSGWILAKMHATLEQAQMAVRSINYDDEFKDLHPGRVDRLAHVEIGWRKGMEGDSKSSANFLFDMLSRYTMLTDENFGEIAKGILQSAKNDFKEIMGRKIESGTWSNAYSTCFTMKNCPVIVRKSMMSTVCILTLYSGLDKDAAYERVMHVREMISKDADRQTVVNCTNIYGGTSVTYFTLPLMSLYSKPKELGSSDWIIQLQISAN